ncbi:hypothetical protein DRW03_15420 [Corallococcus sp. H22C18031201]|uniref:hypothetical protein n=1 Tax=Citreicoccus inhibens TaxID=2849499 RepID=UPI000E76F61B|nr:hypothetical protein [Citreicoccus inhibens]MBU8897926.1 hypothetical protein [Citreicoccus inhibens]RJS21736.1 hypothetical protein DRW03_15420 [Corallococcus sp. H22C18031201]
MKPLAALALLCLASCGEREDGLQLTLGLALAPRQTRAEEPGTAREFVRANGERVVLTRGLVTVGSVELKPCAEGAAWRLLRALSPIGTAEAHSTASPKRLGAPHVIDLARPDGQVLELGTLRPPPGRYCRVRVGFEPADEDAEGLPAASVDVDMAGNSLWLEGTVSPAGGGERRPFLLTSSNVATVEVVLDGLTLSAESPRAERVLTLAYDTWLDGVDLSAASAATEALDSVARSVAMSPPVP